MGDFNFWQRWLFWVAIIAALFGTLMALLNGTGLFAIFNDAINDIFRDGNDPSAGEGDLQQWLIGLLGTVMALWGILIAFLARYPFKNRERWAWQALFISFLYWLVMDNGLSLYYEAYFNVVFNLGFVVALGLPLWFTRHEFA